MQIDNGHSASEESDDAINAVEAKPPIANRRRGFLKSLGLAGAALSAGALFSSRGPAKAADGVPRGDIDILRLLAAAETMRTRGKRDIGIPVCGPRIEPLDHGFSVNKGAPGAQEFSVKIRNDSI